MDSGITKTAVRITLNELAPRPGLAPVSGDRRHQRCAFAFWERKPARMVIVNREQVGGTRQALDTGWRRGRRQSGRFRRRPTLPTVSAVRTELGALIGAHPTEQAAIGELDDSRFLQAGG